MVIVMTKEKKRCEQCGKDISVQGWHNHQKWHTSHAGGKPSLRVVQSEPDARWRVGYRAGFADGLAYANEHEAQPVVSKRGA